MLIRKWQESDLERISELEKECFSDPWNYAMLRSSFLLNNFCGLIVEKEGKIVGYVGATYIFEDGEILLVAVEKENRRKGYGENLLNSVSDCLKEKGVKNLFLEVRKSNQSAIKCYQKNGFLTVGERKRYYSDGEDAIIMEKKLLKD